jgi:TPR repeat protein
MNRLTLGTALVLFAMAISSTGYAVTPEEATMIATAAERGSDGAQVLLAVMYLNGDGGRPKDEKLAAHWFEQAATQGNAYAQQMLGDLYEQGRGVPKNLKVAADWREKAANRGNVQAQLKLGKMYLSGEGVDKNADKAEYWLNRAAIEGNNSEAQYLLGKMYRLHADARQNRELADNLLARSAAQGYEDAIRFLHFMEGLGFRVEEGFYQRTPDLHRLAEDGDPEAQYQLAMRYESGAFGEKQDNEKALYWFRQAAASGHVMAMKSLAHIYQNGLAGTAVDLKAAQYWSEKARAAEK